MKNNFELKFIQNLIFSNYGLSVKADQIEGELDDNFKLNHDGKSYFFKVYPIETDLEFVSFQCDLLNQLKTFDKTPKNILTNKKKSFASFIDDKDSVRYFRMNEWIDGRLWSSINPIGSKLRENLGYESARLVEKLEAIKNNYSRTNFSWDLANFLWVENHYNKIKLKKEYCLVIKTLITDFKLKKNKFEKLRKSLIHNDLNDNNIILSKCLKKPEVIGIIDFGDCVKSQLINELAITCAYGILNSINPLAAACDIIKGFNSKIPLLEIEIDFLYDLVLMRISISIIKSALNKKINPTNSYLQVSKDDMVVLFEKWSSINKMLAVHFFRNACNLSPNHNAEKFKKLICQNKSSIEILFQKKDLKKLKSLDLSVSSKWLSNDLISDAESFEKKIYQNPDITFFGGYLETRVVYDSLDYERLTDSGFENRNTHLGIDFWLKDKIRVHSIEDGYIKIITNDTTSKGYGGLIIIEHNIGDITYYSLYGHLSDQTKSEMQVGDFVKKGDKIGEIGCIIENGGWCPHLHFQLMLTLLDYQNDFPGVCMKNEKDIWSSICPDPVHILNIKKTHTSKFDESELKNSRKKYLPNNLKLSYNKPIYIVRGFNQFLYSNSGKKFLDTVNNIAHVGHQNMNVTQAANEQIGILNTNTRYLHDEIISLSKNLKSKFPKKLSKIYFVNSGSEANELAIRMSSLFTDSENYIVMQGGYHGNTNKTIEISSYKYSSKGGKGKAKNIFEIPMPDKFRGKYRGKGAEKKYFGEFEKLILKAKKLNKKISAMIFEPIISCGGQIEMPENFIKMCKKFLKEHNILMIADEVQTGFGRVGEKYWGFELHNVIPDIVTLGKPMGNGHPIGAVVCTDEISKKFDNGMEFFSSFGGNPVSCRIANEVIYEIDRKKLQINALKTGAFLKNELKSLSRKYPIIGNVRGKGLFIGIELVDKDLNPETEKANYLVNRMKELGVLMSNDGLDKNVIKIKPPLIFTIKDSKKLIMLLEKVFLEDFML